ncbi:MAG TPA: response regulator [Terriglobia bacterium]|nr:response regulator [Terriglobia bacterium]
MSRKILLIDDEPAIVEVTRATLEILAGWAVIAASSGSEGVALAAAEQPDAILLDVMMPDMDGPRTLKDLQAGARTGDIPVVFLTAKVQAADIRRFRNLGAAGVIAKPFDPLRLASEVSSILGWKTERGKSAEVEG